MRREIGRAHVYFPYQTLFQPRIAISCAHDAVVQEALFFFFFNDPAPTEIYTLSLYDALPIYDSDAVIVLNIDAQFTVHLVLNLPLHAGIDRKSTRLNSSHLGISYAVFCL